MASNQALLHTISRSVPHQNCLSQAIRDKSGSIHASGGGPFGKRKRRMTVGNSELGPAVASLEPQQINRHWWESNPMTYDWDKTLQIDPGTLKWYEEIDRRFLDSAYYAVGENRQPFGLFLQPDLVNAKQVLEIGCG